MQKHDKSSETSEKLALTVARDVVDAAPIGFAQYLSGIPSGAKASYLSDEVRLTPKSTPKAERKDLIVALHYCNTPIEEPGPWIAARYPAIRDSIRNYQLEHQEAWFEVHPELLIMSDNEREEFKQMSDQTSYLRRKYKVFVKRLLHEAYYYKVAVTFYHAAYANMCILSRYNGRHPFKDFATSFRWSVLHRITGVFSRFPVPIGLDNLLIANSKYAVGRSAQNVPIISIPMWTMDIFGNRGTTMVDPTTLMSQTVDPSSTANGQVYATLKDLFTETDSDSPDAIISGMLPLNMLAMVNSYAAFDGAPTTPRAINAGTVTMEVEVNDSETYPSHLLTASTAGAGSENGTYDTKFDAYSGKYDLLKHDPIISAVYNSFKQWENYLKIHYSFMGTIGNEKRDYYVNVLHLFEESQTASQVNKAILANSNIEIEALANMMTYRKDNNVTTATIVRCSLPSSFVKPIIEMEPGSRNSSGDLTTSAQIKANPDYGIEFTTNSNWFSDDRRADTDKMTSSNKSLDGMVNQTVFEANFERYNIDDEDDTGLMLHSFKAWPSLTPAIINSETVMEGFRYVEPDDDHEEGQFVSVDLAEVQSALKPIVLNCLPAGGHTCEDQNSVTSILGPNASLLDLYSSQNGRIGDNRIETIGVSQDVALDFVNKSNAMVFVEDPTQIFTDVTPIIDNSDIYECGFNILCTFTDSDVDDGLTSNMFVDTYAKRENYYDGGIDVFQDWIADKSYIFKDMRSGLSNSLPDDKLVYADIVHLVNSDQMTRMRHALLFVGIGIFQSPLNIFANSGLFNGHTIVRKWQHENKDAIPEIIAFDKHFSRQNVNARNPFPMLAFYSMNKVGMPRTSAGQAKYAAALQPNVLALYEMGAIGRIKDTESDRDNDNFNSASYKFWYFNPQYGPVLPALQGVPIANFAEYSCFEINKDDDKTNVKSYDVDSVLAVKPKVAAVNYYIDDHNQYEDGSHHVLPSLGINNLVDLRTPETTEQNIIFFLNSLTFGKMYLTSFNLPSPAEDSMTNPEFNFERPAFKLFFSSLRKWPLALLARVGVSFVGSDRVCHFWELSNANSQRYKLQSPSNAPTSAPVNTQNIIATMEQPVKHQRGSMDRARISGRGGLPDSITTIASRFSYSSKQDKPSSSGEKYSNKRHKYGKDKSDATSIETDVSVAEGSPLDMSDIKEDKSAKKSLNRKVTGSTALETQC